MWNVVILLFRVIGVIRMVVVVIRMRVGGKLEEIMDICFVVDVSCTIHCYDGRPF